MKNVSKRKMIFDISDYSFEFYKKFFWKFALISVILHIPVMLISYYANNYMIQPENMTKPSVLALVMGVLFLQMVYLVVLRPILDAYIIMKVYDGFTAMSRGVFYKLKITSTNILKKLPGIVAYMMLIGALMLFSIFLLMPGLIYLMYFIFGYEKLGLMLPGVELPLVVDFWYGVFVIIVSLLSSKWLIYLFSRIMFGMQAMFIDNLDVNDAIKKSIEISKESVTVSLVTVTIGFFVQAYLALIGILFFVPLFFGNLEISNTSNIINVISSDMFSLLGNGIIWAVYPFFVLVMTLLYIYLKIQKDALALEFDMIKMISGQEEKVTREMNFVDEKLVLNIDNLKIEDNLKNKDNLKNIDNLKNKVEEGNATICLAGIPSRLSAHFIDIFIAIGLLLSVLITSMYFLSKSATDVFVFLYNAFPLAIKDKTMLILFLGFVILFVIVCISLMEMLMNGSSPGKKIVGIRVIKLNGERASALRHLFRNLFRLVDIFPGVYFVGLILVLFNRKQRRLGDWIAGTIVVRVYEEVEVAGKSIAALYGSNLPKRENIYNVTALEYKVVKGFMEYEELSIARKAFFAYNLNVYFRIKFKIGEKYQNPYDFFNDILSMNEKKYET